MGGKIYLKKRSEFLNQASHARGEVLEVTEHETNISKRERDAYREIEHLSNVLEKLVEKYDNALDVLKAGLDGQELIDEWEGRNQAEGAV